MKTLGITGGIGSGKTTVCRILETLGVPVYYADDRSKWLLANDPEIRRALVAAFGPQVIYADGSLDRKGLGAVVFADADRLKTLENIVHPAVSLDFKSWQQARRAEGHRYVVKEAALLFEAGTYKDLDFTCLVQAPVAVRIARVTARDQVTAAEVQARIDRQMPETEKEKLADGFLVNDEAQPLLPQVLALHARFAAA